MKTTRLLRAVQMDLFSKQEPRWTDLPASIREEVKGLLRRLLREAAIVGRNSERRGIHDERENHG